MPRPEHLPATNLMLSRGRSACLEVSIRTAGENCRDLPALYAEVCPLYPRLICYVLCSPVSYMRGSGRSAITSPIC